MSSFRIPCPNNVVNRINILQKCRDPFQPVGELGGNRQQVDSSALLEISELRDLEPIEHHLPADPPGAERWRFPVVFFELDVVLSKINPNRAQ